MNGTLLFASYQSKLSGSPRSTIRIRRREQAYFVASIRMKPSRMLAWDRLSARSLTIWIKWKRTWKRRKKCCTHTTRQRRRSRDLLQAKSIILSCTNQTWTRCKLKLSRRLLRLSNFCPQRAFKTLSLKCLATISQQENLLTPARCKAIYKIRLWSPHRRLRIRKASNFSLQKHHSP